MDERYLLPAGIVALDLLRRCAVPLHPGNTSQDIAASVADLYYLTVTAHEEGTLDPDLYDLLASAAVGAETLREGYRLAEQIARDEQPDLERAH